MVTQHQLVIRTAAVPRATALSALLHFQTPDHSWHQVTVQLPPHLDVASVAVKTPTPVRKIVRDASGNITEIRDVVEYPERPLHENVKHRQGAA